MGGELIVMGYGRAKLPPTLFGVGLGGRNYPLLFFGVDWEGWKMPSLVCVCYLNCCSTFPLTCPYSRGTWRRFAVAGLLTSLPHGMPSRQHWLTVALLFLGKNESYSSGYCCRFSQHSLVSCLELFHSDAKLQRLSETANFSQRKFQRIFKKENFQDVKKTSNTCLLSD